MSLTSTIKTPDRDTIFEEFQKIGNLEVKSETINSIKAFKSYTQSAPADQMVFAKTLYEVPFEKIIEELKHQFPNNILSTEQSIELIEIVKERFAKECLQISHTSFQAL